MISLINNMNEYFRFIYLCVICLILFGTANNYIDSQLQEETRYNPLFRACLMFMGETLCFCFLLLREKQSSIDTFAKSSTKNEEFIPKYVKFFKIYCYCISGICELIVYILQSFCLIYLNIAFTMSLYMLTVIYIIVHKTYFINRPVFKHQKIGMILFLVGMLMIIFEVLLYRNENQYAIQGLVCIGLMIVSQFFDALSLISEKYFLEKLENHPQQANIVKGITGFIASMILYYPIGLLMEATITNDNTIKPIIDLHKDVILMLCIFRIFGSCLYNYFVMKFLQYCEPLGVCSLDSGRVIIIWIIQISMNFYPEELIDIAGSIFIVLASMIINEIIILPFWGCKKSAEESMKENELYRRTKRLDTSLRLFL